MGDVARPPSRVALTLGLLLLLAVGAGACGRAESRHESGLLVVGSFPDVDVPEALRDAWAAYDLLARTYPDDFACVSPNLDDGKVPAGVVTEGGRRMLSDLADGAAPALPTNLATNPPDLPEKLSGRLADAAGRAGALQPVAVTATDSLRTVQARQDALIDWARDPRFRDAGIHSTNVDLSTCRVVLGVERLTPVLADAVVATYGTESVVVQIEDGSGDRPA